MYLTRKKITTNNVKSKYSTSYIISPDLSWVQDKVTFATFEIFFKKVYYWGYPMAESGQLGSVLKGKSCNSIKNMTSLAK